jgi:G8 domain
MVRERGATFVACKLATAINFATAAVLLSGIFLFAGSALAQQVDNCPNGKLDPGNQNNPPDLIIANECHVGRGGYYFNNVNIITDSMAGHRIPGKLIFDDDTYGTTFSARSIVVENGGSLEAGTPDKPFGSGLHIHLYGKDQGVQGIGIICKSVASDPGGDLLALVNAASPIPSGTAMERRRFTCPAALATVSIHTRLYLLTMARWATRRAISVIRCSPFPMAAA